MSVRPGQAHGAFRHARLCAERDAVLAIAPDATERLAALDMQLRLERLPTNQPPVRGQGLGLA